MASANPNIFMSALKSAGTISRVEPMRAKCQCSRCQDRGVIWLVGSPEALSTGRLRALLEGGQACLCLCEQAQFWLSQFFMDSFPMSTKWGAEVRGTAVPTRGVPDGLLTGERAVEWLKERYLDAN